MALSTFTKLHLLEQYLNTTQHQDKMLRRRHFRGNASTVWQDWFAQRARLSMPETIGHKTAYRPSETMPPAPHPYAHGSRRSNSCQRE